MSALDPLEFVPWETEVHGHRVIYRMAGEGPPVVLIHGMVNSSRHWEQVALRLAENHRVIAPDLIGHGDSAAVRGDYSLGAHAASIRDLLSVLGVERATIVGHSLGGGIAMQFFYQFPQRTDRLILVSSGGLGPEVSPLLRAAAAPGAASALWVVSHRKVLGALWELGDRMKKKGNKTGVQLQAVARALRPLQGAGSRRAFIQTLRAVIDVRGQRVNARDRLYLLSSFPSLIVWGERDNTIPLEHGREAHDAIPGNRFETLPKAAHFPHLEDPEGLARVIADFVEETEPGHIDDSNWADAIAARPPRRREGHAGAGPSHPQR